MCGIAGFVDYSNSTTIEILSKMTDTLIHRGPDGSGTEIYETKSGIGIGFGQRRLAIIDLSTGGKQPMSKHNLSIIYNGEIYNYTEIAEELRNAGYKFNSTSDTEVILSSIDYWGIEKSLLKFNGMFAFVLFDHLKECLTIVRDRAGVKPLFLYKKNDILLFASEIKAFHKHPKFTAEVNHAVIPSFIQYGYVPHRNSIFKDVSKLLPGHILKIDLNTRSESLLKYWDVYDHYNKPKINIGLNEAMEETSRLLDSAFNYRMVADVPIGIFLSGGYDSSIVSAILQRDSSAKIKTFTIGFENDNFNEAPYAKEVAEYLDTEHYEYICTDKEAQEILPTLPYYYDEPFADASAIPTILVSKVAVNQVKVALSADAGDEIFGGYNKYNRTIQNFKYANKLPKILRSPNLFKAISSFPFPKAKYVRILQNLSSIYHNKNTHLDIMNLGSQSLHEYDMSKLMLRPVNELYTHFQDSSLINSGNDYLNKMLAVDYKTYLVDDILTKVDRATMSVSLEGREPLLDYRIVEFASMLPSEFKIKNSEKKYILKKLTHELLPKKLMDRPKMGFGIPYFEWLRGDLRYLISEYLDDSRISKQAIFNTDFVSKKKKMFFSGNNRSNSFIWKMLSFQMWYKYWCE